MKLVQTLGVAAMLSLPVAAAEAAVTLNINSISGVWTDSTGAEATVSGIGTNKLSWGVPVGDDPSSYVFDPETTPINGILPDTVFDLGKFTHNNFRILLPSIETAELTIDIMGTAQNGQVVPLSLTSVFVFNHLETPNNEPCDPMGATVCPDVVSVQNNMGASESFFIDGVEYILTIEGFEVMGELMQQFVTEEEQMNMATLRASFTAVPTAIPLPASLPLFLAAIGGLSLLSRRRRI